MQLKTVNHRFVDIKVRGAPLDPSIEDKVQALVRNRIQRGAVALSVRIEGGGGAGSVRVDRDAARRMYHELAQLSLELGIREPIGIEAVCSQPGVMVPVDVDEDTAELSSSVLEALGQALDALMEMRGTEGAALAADLGKRVAHVRELAGEIKALADKFPDEARNRLRDRVNRLLKDTNTQVDESRLAQEIALVADRGDITEEVVRIHSHCAQFEKLMQSDKPVGRRLDFLVQELGREINTVGSKSQSAQLAALVVEAKAELEKVREQVQNVE